MKHLILTLLFSVVIFAADKQIIIGSYLDEKNSINELKELSLHVEQDEKLKFLIQKNSLKSKSKKIGKYYVVSILPLTSYVQLLRTLKSLQKYYPDSYVIDAPEVLTVIKPEVTKVEVVKVVAEIKPLMKREESISKKTKVYPKEAEVKDNKDFLLILLALIIIALAIYMRKKAKKEK